MILALLGAALAAQGHLVIVEGDKDPERAAFEQMMWKADNWPTHGDWPKLLDSATVPGLKPGFHVLALGWFESPEDAKALAEAINDLGGGAYVREVSLEEPFHQLATVMKPVGELPRPCPSKLGAIYIDNHAWGTETSEDWGWFSADVGEAARKAGVHVASREQWLVDRCDGTPVKLQKQETVGYWVLKPGAQPLWIQHDMTDSVLSQASAYLGVQLSLE